MLRIETSAPPQSDRELRNALESAQSRLRERRLELNSLLASAPGERARLEEALAETQAALAVSQRSVAVLDEELTAVEDTRARLFERWERQNRERAVLELGAQRLTFKGDVERQFREQQLERLLRPLESLGPALSFIGTVLVALALLSKVLGR